MYSAETLRPLTPNAILSDEFKEEMLDQKLKDFAQDFVETLLEEDILVHALDGKEYVVQYDCLSIATLGLVEHPKDVLDALETLCQMGVKAVLHSERFKLPIEDEFAITGFFYEDAPFLAGIKMARDSQSSNA